MRPFARTAGSRGNGLFGAALGLDDLERMLGEKPAGEAIAHGVEDVIAAFKERVKDTMPAAEQERLFKDLRARLENVDNVTLYADGDDLTIAGDGVFVVDGPESLAEALSSVIGGKRKGDGRADMSGFDLGSILNAMRFSDRHGGRSAFADVDIDLLRRASRDRRLNKTGMDAFTETLHAHAKKTAAPPKKAGESHVVPLMVASTSLAMALMRVNAFKTADAADLVNGFVKLVDDLCAQDPARAGNLARYLDAYGVNLATTAQRLKDYVRQGRSDQAEALVCELSRITPACLNVMRDAAEKATQAFDEATTI